MGINTAIASTSGTFTGYGFAVPANIVSKVVLDLKECGMVQRGYLGLMIRSVNASLAREKELTKGLPCETRRGKKRYASLNLYRLWINWVSNLKKLAGN